MIDLQNSHEPLDDIEALVRSARDYVRASGDLRPRVLEMARVERAERKAQRRIWQAAIFVVLLGMLTTTFRRQPEGPGADQTGSTAAAGLLFSAATRMDSGESNWDMVDAYTKLRRRQAQLLRLAL